MRVVSTLKDPPKRQVISHIGIRGGFPIIFGHIGGKTSFKLPYFGFTYKQNFGTSKIVFWEAELGYFAYQSKDTFIDSIKEHAISITLSLVWDIPIGSDFYMYPKIGVGYMMLYSKTNIPNMKSGFGGAILLKPSLALGYEIAKDWRIVLDGTLMMAQDVKEHKFGNFDYYLIPSLGVTSRF